MTAIVTQARQSGTSGLAKRDGPEVTVPTRGHRSVQCDPHLGTVSTFHELALPGTSWLKD